VSFTKDAQTKLKKLGCFKRVDGYIDTSKDRTGEMLKIFSLLQQLLYHFHTIVKRNQQTPFKYYL
jgi:hypothetical protein